MKFVSTNLINAYADIIIIVSLGVCFDTVFQTITNMQTVRSQLKSIRKCRACICMSKSVIKKKYLIDHIDEYYSIRKCRTCIGIIKSVVKKKNDVELNI